MDFVSFVQVGGVMYTQDATGTTAPLGRTILKTRCEYSKGAPEKGYRQQSGDSSYLPAGTEVRELVGFDPRFRVAAVAEGRTLVFQAPPPDGARTFAEVYPGIGEHITALHVTSQRDGTTVLARLDASRLPTLVPLLLSARYAPNAGFSVDDVRLTVRLDDGTSVNRPYDRETGQLLPGVQVPVAVRDAVREALRTTEGQPKPRCIAVPGNYQGPREAEEYVGLTEAVARRRATAAGLELRVLGRDGPCMADRSANRATRVNVDIRDGVVRDAARF
ncbi:MAG TPA: hypothetical protein VNA30_02745 [Mycobacteriales bacterium]|nr:hypothetical protein [Mycobacteriales bacterium]